MGKLIEMESLCNEQYTTFVRTRPCLSAPPRALTSLLSIDHKCTMGTSGNGSDGGSMRIAKSGLHFGVQRCGRIAAGASSAPRRDLVSVI